jgi:hypothetical protein
MTADDLDDVTDAVRECCGHIDTRNLHTHVTGRAGEFHLTVDDHQYLVTIEHVEAET